MTTVSNLTSDEHSALLAQRMYTIKELAEILRVSAKSVQRMIERGHINVVRFGKLVRITQAEVERLQAEGAGLRHKV